MFGCSNMLDKWAWGFIVKEHSLWGILGNVCRVRKVEMFLQAAQEWCKFLN